MKKIITTVGLLMMILGIFSCKNEEWNFSDFDYTTTYFPYQYPVRTLVFGDYTYDNSGDKNLKFLISANMGGVYENKSNVNVGYTVDNTLADNLFTFDGTPIKAMPASWYTLSNTSQMVIPNGSFSGGVTVQLTEDFLSDTNSISAYWVIPLRITTSTTDSILSGEKNLSNPDPRIADNWTIVPKNFTIFGVKYVNEWHGKYLLRGTSVIKESNGDIVETIKYHAKFLEANAVVSLLTSRRNQVKYSNAIKQTLGGSPGNFEMKLDFDPEDLTTATLTTSNKYPLFPVTGTAKMVKGAESWNNIARDVVYLDYSITVGTRTHEVKDTLVFRDKAVKFEEFTPKVILP
ncbi:MAG: DUF5627 domain-containing protein [Bacteroidales bacterium]|nr:DUF5627 domain-containing protein [Bacteroidales bacterium]